MAGIFKAYDVRGLYPEQLDESEYNRLFLVVLPPPGAGSSARVRTLELRYEP